MEGLRRRLANVLLICAALFVLMAGQRIENASAASVGFCGQLKSSGSWCPGYLSGGWGTSWRYTSNTYRGGGAIDEMRAWMAVSNYYYSYQAYALNATFVNGCWYSIGGLALGNNYGMIKQTEHNGAKHTIYGRNDNSPNHTNCRPNVAV